MMSVVNLNANAKIGVRIGIGYLLIALLLLITCGLAWRALDEAEAQFTTYGMLSDNTARAGDIEADINSVRRLLLAFAESGDAQTRSSIETLDKETRKQIADAIAAYKSEARRSLMREVESSFTEYMANVQRLFGLREALTKAVDQGMNVVGPQAREALSKIIDTAVARKNFEIAAYAGVAQEDLGLMRINATRYLTKPDQTLLSNFDSKSIELVAALDALEKAATSDELASLRLVQDSIPTYTHLFRTAREEQSAIDALVTGTNARIATLMEQRLGELKESQQKSVLETKNSVLASSMANERQLLLIGGIALVLTALVATFVTRGITRPIAGMTGAMGALASGNLAIEIPAQANKDELGEMAKAVQVFKDNAIRVMALEEEQAMAAARAEAEKKQALATLAHGFEEQVGVVVTTLSASARQLQTAASSMSETAEATSQRAVAVAAASEEATTNVQTVATAAEELSASIGEISRQVANSSQIANQAVLDVAATGKSVEALAEAAQKIGDVVKLISDIASQTNLLALNATIEAARAGEAGKGFAVVASEVKNLASQTARATSEIGGQITAIQAATGDSVVAMRAIGETIGKMNEIAAAIASAVEEQGAATQEIARNVQQAAAGTADVSLNITAVNAAANETGVAAGQVKAAASTMGAQAEDLSRAVDGFVSRVRAA